MEIMHVRATYTEEYVIADFLVKLFGSWTCGLQVGSILRRYTETTIANTILVEARPMAAYHASAPDRSKQPLIPLFTS